jgi:hypothetical protein
MPRVPFGSLPDESRLWVFGVGRPLDEPEEQSFLGAVDRFLDGWAAHGVPLRCGRDWRHGRFLLVAVDEASEPPSGCSIDAMVHVLKDQERELDAPIVDSSPVWFFDDGRVRRLPRAEFKRLAEAGTVGPETVVFDNSVTRLTDERAGRWERPARESWHGKAFFPRDD